jgi:hypothetical protein
MAVSGTSRRLKDERDGPAPVAVTPASGDALGEIVAALRLTNDAVVLLGWSAEGMADEGVAALETRRGDRGRFRAATWPSRDGAGHQDFLALVEAPMLGEADEGALVRLRSSGARAPSIACLPRPSHEAHTFAREVAARLGPHAHEAAHFLIDAYVAATGQVLPSVHALVTAMIEVAAGDGGVVEIAGLADDEHLYLQGWLSDGLSGVQRVIVCLGDAIADCSAGFAAFDRADMPAPATGFVALCRMPVAGGLAPRRIYVWRPGAGFERLSILPNVQRLRSDEVSPHLRAVLPTLRSDAQVERLLRAAARPRYTGADTVNLSDSPVRASVDLVIRIEEAGWYLTGWMLDPHKLVAAVTVRTADGFAERIDPWWVRVQRADVTAGFAEHPAFKGRVADDEHGFTVFAPDEQVRPAAPAWLEFELADGQWAFMPLRVERSTVQAAARRVAESFDVHKPSAPAIVEHHLGPMMLRTLGRRLDAPPARILRTWEPRPLGAIVVPVVEAGLRTAVLVSHLAREPVDAAILFVLAGPARGLASELGRQLDFYGVEAGILAVDETVDAVVALAAGAREAEGAERLLFLSPRCHPITEGWATRLFTALGDGGVPRAVSPTLLYEDWSLRFSGLDEVRFLDGPPYVDCHASRAGYPRGWASGAGRGPSLAGALECCALTASALDRAGGFSGGFVLPHLRGVDFFLRLREAGGEVEWLPDVELYALEDVAATSDYVQRTGELIDGWSFKARWVGHLPEVR